jgi:hypothetical protein
MRTNCSLEYLVEEDYKSQSLVSHQREVKNITHKKKFAQLGEI